MDTPHRARVLDLRGAAFATLSFRSQFEGARPAGRVDISLDGVTWDTVALVPASDPWTWLEVDLSAFAGRPVFIRFVLEEHQPAPGEIPAVWLIDNVRLRIYRGPG